jgi:hypothetical protein
MERIYPAYGDKIRRNTDEALASPEAFAAELNLEYQKFRKSSAKDLEGLEKLPVRIYGSGDYVREHLEVLKRLNFKFFLISKTLTEPDFEEDLEQLLQLPNLTSIVLSFDKHNEGNHSGIRHRFNQDKIKFSYTGLVPEFSEAQSSGTSYNIFFNISNKNADKALSKGFSQRCPADSGDIPLQKACTKCHKCWHSTTTQTPDWNSTIA